MALKLTKEKVLDAMEEVIELDAKLVNAFKGLRMNKDAKYRTTEFLIFRQFHSYRRLLTLVDDQLAIDRSSVNQMALLYLLQRFDDFFWRFIPRMEIHFLKKWDSHIAKKHMED
ncbi:hypothetical protein AAVH_18549 [Aphelenchoides avenae]|nr:hypothetical protein AAVH_18549 [Aphelenchus avenae]